jgi:hypothetical protein
MDPFGIVVGFILASLGGGKEKTVQNQKGAGLPGMTPGATPTWTPQGIFTAVTNAVQPHIGPVSKTPGIAQQPPAQQPPAQQPPAVQPGMTPAEIQAAIDKAKQDAIDLLKQQQQQQPPPQQPPPQQAPPKQTPQTREYKIASGDMAYSVAKRFSGTSDLKRPDGWSPPTVSGMVGLDVTPDPSDLDPYKQPTSTPGTFVWKELGPANPGMNVSGATPSPWQPGSVIKLPAHWKANNPPGTGAMGAVNASPVVVVGWDTTEEAIQDLISEVGCV